MASLKAALKVIQKDAQTARLLAVLTAALKAVQTAPQLDALKAV